MGVLAMAGLAEGAVTAGLLIIGGGVAVAYVVSVVALAWRSRFVAGLACVVCMVAGLLSEPWAALSAPPAGDPDVVALRSSWQRTCVVWAAGQAWCLAVFYLTGRPRSPRLALREAAGPLGEDDRA
jgi:hypothetical protein